MDRAAQRGPAHRGPVLVDDLGGPARADVAGPFCAADHPFYVKATAWAPDGSTVYVATTGFHPENWQQTFPLTGLCDAVAAFPATRRGGLAQEWVNYTGCNRAGHGAVQAPGMGAFTPGASGGRLLTGSSGAGLYSRGRGMGADDMLLTTAGLWIASDNLDGTDTCGGVSGHAGICFLSYRS